MVDSTNNDAGGNENTNKDGAQATLESTNASEVSSTNPATSQDAESWIGDERFFQSGAKAGQLKPAHRVSGADSEKATAAMFSPAGSVNPTGKTDGASFPDIGEGKSTGAKTAKSAKPKKAKSESDDYITAAALYNGILVAGCKMISDEYEQSPEMQKQTITAALEYFRESDVQLPPWLGLAAVTVINIAAAVKTPKGRTKLGNLIAGVKAWIVKRRG